MEPLNFQRVNSPHPVNPDYVESYVNINIPERVASVIAGITLLAKWRTAPLTSPVSLLSGSYLIFRGITGNCALYHQLDKNSNKTRAINIRHSFTVNKPRAEVYAFWRNLENLPAFMRHLVSVKEKDGKISHWKAKIPGNAGTLSWDAEIVNEEENNVIGWRSIDSAVIDNAGKVEFYDAPTNGFTILKVIFSYHLPAGGLGTEVAKLFNPVVESYIKEDIMNFKEHIESLPSIEIEKDSAKEISKIYGTKGTHS